MNLKPCVWAAVLSMAACTFSLGAQSPAHTSPAESRTSQRMEALRSDPLGLHAFLQTMPLGADLHMHLSGAVYAETLIQDAADDHLCVDPQRLAFVPNHGMNGTPPRPQCAAGTVSAADALADQKLYDELIDSFSMRGFVPTPGWDAHDQFFATFGRFGGTSKSHLGEWVDEVATRAAAENEQYLEVMTTPEYSHAIALSRRVHWEGNPAALRDTLVHMGLFDEVEADRAEIAGMDEMRNARERCGTAQASPACKVQVRYLYQLLRANAPEQVFAQMLLGFEVASHDGRVVGVNLVQPEDARISMDEYATQMKMLGYLHRLYPKVHISLHAGELAPGLVPPEGLTFHVRDAVEVAGAERIGHGVDVMYETRPEQLLREMADHHILVEINLTSNDLILGVRGGQHPLREYIAAGVPFALSTDDEGVSRIDLTHEYERAAEEQGLTYAQLKQSVRASLEHSFLPGDSLWDEEDVFTHMREECATGSHPGAPSARCTAFLHTSEKATQQWELETRFHTFETEQAALPMPRPIYALFQDGHP